MMKYANYTLLFCCFVYSLYQFPYLLMQAYYDFQFSEQNMYFPNSCLEQQSKGLLLCLKVSLYVFDDSTEFCTSSIQCFSRKSEAGRTAIRKFGSLLRALIIALYQTQGSIPSMDFILRSSCCYQVSIKFMIFSIFTNYFSNFKNYNHIEEQKLINQNIHQTCYRQGSFDNQISCTHTVRKLLQKSNALLQTIYYSQIIFLVLHKIILQFLLSSNEQLPTFLNVIPKLNKTKELINNIQTEVLISKSIDTNIIDTIKFWAYQENILEKQLISKEKLEKELSSKLLLQIQCTRFLKNLIINSQKTARFLEAFNLYGVYFANAFMKVVLREVHMIDYMLQI